MDALNEAVFHIEEAARCLGCLIARYPDGKIFAQVVGEKGEIEGYMLQFMKVETGECQTRLVQ